MYSSVIDAVQEKVDKLANNLCKEMKECPTFKVYSVYHTDNEFDSRGQTLILTLEYRSHKIGRILYPSKHQYYGHEPLLEVMKEMIHQLT